MPSRISFLSLQFTTGTKSEIWNAVTDGKKIQLATLNPEFILTALKQPDFAATLRRMPLCSLDGIGLLWALKLWRFLLGQDWPLEQLSGSDLTAELFKFYQNGERSFFLLGGAPGISRKAKARIEQLYPSCRIVGEDDGGQIDPDNLHLDPELLSKIERAKPDILLVGFGCRKQELWMEAAALKLSVPVMIGVGGTLNFYVGRKRAPSWLRRLHLEWLFRGLTEKGHWRRVWFSVIIFPLYAFSWLITASLRGKVRK